jgi:hypothetical protein
MEHRRPTLGNLMSREADLLKSSPELVEMMAKPIDFEALQRERLLVKFGPWYMVRNLRDLPEHARLRISEIKKIRGGNLVTFVSASKYEAIAKKLRERGQSKAALRRRKIYTGST